ncbi:hypothetical protein [Uliginosibacterium gangwonense]|uniref:hypothetical protein n=1 Tax=Uliginosibacterium gangwonense TaxID=392736 RepID=UPI0012F7B173|nr:hypothetical protein [Uliginosibacterium gangwonense]
MSQNAILLSGDLSVDILDENGKPPVSRRWKLIPSKSPQVGHQGSRLPVPCYLWVEPRPGGGGQAF